MVFVSIVVMPAPDSSIRGLATAGILLPNPLKALDSRFRGNDEVGAGDG